MEAPREIEKGVSITLRLSNEDIEAYDKQGIDAVMELFKLSRSKSGICLTDETTDSAVTTKTPIAALNGIVDSLKALAGVMVDAGEVTADEIREISTSNVLFPSGGFEPGEPDKSDAPK